MIFGIIKKFYWVKKIHVEDRCHAICNFVPHLSWLWNFPECFKPKIREKIREKTGKTGKKPVKNREILGTFSCDWPEQLLLLDFFDYLKKTFPADSGRSGSPRANLRPFLEFGWRVLPVKVMKWLKTGYKKEFAVDKTDSTSLSTRRCGITFHYSKKWF